MTLENHIAGFTVSALIHLGLLLIAALGMTTIHLPIEKPHTTPLKLSMFRPPPKPTVNVEPVVETMVEPVVETTPIPVPPKPRIERKEKKPPPVKTTAVPEQPRKPEPQEPVKKQEAIPRPAVTPQETHPIAETKKVVEQAETDIAPTPDHTRIKRIEQAYRARLQAAIEANKTYPRRARRLRQQGSVVVEFDVEKNGSIMNLMVTSASDSDILDSAALQTVQKVSGLLPLPEELNRSAWRFSIPINYYLR